MTNAFPPSSLFSFRYNAEQVALSSYGDSEAESEDEDEEDEDAEVGAALHHAEEDEDDFDSGTLGFAYMDSVFARQISPFKQ